MRIIALRVRGRNVFHVRAINRSYRIRGMVARIQMKSAASDRASRAKVSSWAGFGGTIRKRVAVKSLIIKILIYSAMKIRANLPPLNSVLKPDTSSDSPSAKSKGVRFVSARVEINHITVIGVSSRTGGMNIIVVRCEKSNVSGRIRVVMRSSLILTS